MNMAVGNKIMLKQNSVKYKDLKNAIFKSALL